MQNWKRRQREEARSVWPRRCRGAACPQGIFSGSRFWSCSGEETPSYLLDHLAFGSTGSNELAGLCIKSVCFLSSAGGPSGFDRRFGHIALHFSLIPRNTGFFEQKSPQNRKIWVPDAKKIPSAQKLEKFWVLEKKVLDLTQTGRTQMEFQCWQIRVKHWKRPGAWKPGADPGGSRQAQLPAY